MPLAVLGGKTKIISNDDNIIKDWQSDDVKRMYKAYCGQCKNVGIKPKSLKTLMKEKEADQKQKAKQTGTIIHKHQKPSPYDRLVGRKYTMGDIALHIGQLFKKNKITGDKKCAIH